MEYIIYWNYGFAYGFGMSSNCIAVIFYIVLWQTLYGETHSSGNQKYSFIFLLTPMPNFTVPIESCSISIDEKTQCKCTTLHYTLH